MDNSIFFLWITHFSVKKGVATLETRPNMVTVSNGKGTAHMTHTLENIERCPAYAIIMVDRRGIVRQLAAATLDDAIAAAAEFATYQLSVTVEDPDGHVIYESA